MRLKLRNITVKTQTQWHKWFAWRPVELEDMWVWWEWVERKRENPWRCSPFDYRLVQAQDHTRVDPRAGFKLLKK